MRETHEKMELVKKSEASFESEKVKVNQMLDTLFKHETDSLRVEDEKTDFQLIHQKVQGMFTKSDMEIELKVLDTLKERLEQK